MPNRNALSSRFVLSTKAVTVASIILGSLLYACGIHLANGSYTPGFKFFGIQISLLSTYFSLTLLAVGLAGPWLLKLCGYLLISLHRRPAALAFPADLLPQLQRHSTANVIELPMPRCHRTFQPPSRPPVPVMSTWGSGSPRHGAARGSEP